MMEHGAHQYIDRKSRQAKDETLLGDRQIVFLYSTIRERAPRLFQIATGGRISKWLAWLNYESFIGEKLLGGGDFLKRCGINAAECVENSQHLDTLGKIFRRTIRFWDCRPMPDDPDAVVSPCDAKMLYGALSPDSCLFIKGKFFDYDELIGRDKKKWRNTFADGDFALFRLTPEKYHYNHAPVSGKVIDFYQISGRYHSCNPHAVISACTPHSKNKRFVTIINTDVPGGTQIGLIAMVEIVALMIGDIVQNYSDYRYDNPIAVGTGLFLKKGQPKSQFKPGSSTVVLFFEKGRIRFCEDIVANMFAADVRSILSSGFGMPLVETDVEVRSPIGTARKQGE
jgi:phosphatidylserine decarboxylase